MGGEIDRRTERREGGTRGGGEEGTEGSENRGGERDWFAIGNGLLRKMSIVERGGV